MRYALLENGAIKTYPYTLHQLRLDNPDTSFPRDATLIRLDEHDVVQVADTPMPARSSDAVDVVELTPVLVGDVWAQTWGETPAHPDTISSRADLQAHTYIKDYAKADNFLRAYAKMTPEEVETYVTNNTTTLASTRQLLGKLALAVLLLVRRELS